MRVRVRVRARRVAIQTMSFQSAPQILSFVPPKNTIKNAEGFEPDFTLHEVAYFCHLLLHGDARMVEALFQVAYPSPQV